MNKDQQLTAAPTASCGLAWHFTDTRTALGRVRVLLHGTQLCAPVTVLAEGQGWSSEQHFESLHDAALGLAWMTTLPQSLYLQALSDLHAQQYFFSQHAA